MASNRILILSGARGDTRRYRTLHLHQQLRLAGVDSALSHTTDPRLPELARGAAVVVLHRVSYDPYIAGLINAVHAHQGLVLADIDDLIFDTQAFQWIDSPDFRDAIRSSLYLDHMRRNRQTLDASDAVLASTDYLAQTVRAMGKPCWVHRNAASLEMVFQSELALNRRRAAASKIVLGYASGSPTHNRDFAQVALLLQSMLRAHPDLELRIIGFLDLDASWKAFDGRLKRYPAVPWQDLPAWLAQLDINLAPLLLGNPFAQSKSEIKYMEAALVQVPTLASRTEAFIAAICSGENGLLAGSPDEWQTQLEQLMSPELRRRLGQAAYQAASQAYAPQTRACQAVEVFNQISAVFNRQFRWKVNFGSNQDTRALWWDREVECHPNQVENGLYSLRHRGVKVLAKQVWVYFRRWLARYVPYSKREQP